MQYLSLDEPWVTPKIFTKSIGQKLILFIRGCHDMKNDMKIRPLVQKTKALLFDINLCLNENQRAATTAVLAQGGGYHVWDSETPDTPDSIARVPPDFDSSLWLGSAYKVLRKSLRKVDTGGKFKKEIKDLMAEIKATVRG